MAYTKNSWKSGDVVTSSKLNHMEDGIADAGGTLVIGGFASVEGNITGTADKTWQEIDNALAAGVRCVVILDEASGHVQMVANETGSLDGEYTIIADALVATTTSADGYPSASGGFS